MPFLPKPAAGHAGLGVERHHLVAGRHVDDARARRAVGPVREAASGELARRRFAALAFVLAVHPQQFAGAGVERDDGARACRPSSRRRRPTISGVTWKLNSGAGRDESVLNRHATSSLLKLSLVI